MDELFLILIIIFKYDIKKIIKIVFYIPLPSKFLFPDNTADATKSAELNASKIS
jgi:hypothetical protein